MYDDQPSSVLFSAPPAGMHARGAVKVARVASDDGIGFATVTSVTLTDLAEGQHVFEVKARDRAGNEDLTPARRAFRIVSGPVITAIVPSSGVAGTFVTLSGHGFSAGPVAVAFNGVPALVRTATLAGVTTTVPISATSGPIVVSTPRGAASGLFTVRTTGDFGFTALPPAATSLPGAQGSYALSVVGSGAVTGLVSVGG